MYSFHDAIDFEIEGDFPKYGNDDDRVDSIAVDLVLSGVAEPAEGDRRLRCFRCPNCGEEHECEDRKAQSLLSAIHVSMQIFGAGYLYLL